MSILIPKDLIGLQVAAIKGLRDKIDKRVKHEYIKPSYILFSDGKTIMEFEDQDYYSYHYCDSSAKVIDVYKNKDLWNTLMSNTDEYIADSTELF